METETKPAKEAPARYSKRDRDMVRGRLDAFGVSLADKEATDACLKDCVCESFCIACADEMRAEAGQ